ncbi:HigA family addiction module antidote protein [bacterium]|nr:HigA family addiction module antidote protein [bacterium]
MLKPKRKPSQPGTILREHYLNPRKITITAFAKAIGCSRKHMSRIVNGESRIEAEMAEKISRVLGTTPELWLNLQNSVDLFDAKTELKKWEPAETYLKAI